MTRKERTERLARAQAQQDAIRRARETAQLARLLWPQGAEDELHGKVEVLTAALRRAGQDDAARRIAASAHPAAWRKHKHTHHVHDEGDVTQAQWWRTAEEVATAAFEIKNTTKRILRMAEKIGSTDATLRLLDAAYWAAYDMAGEVESAQYEIPNTCAEKDGVLELFQGLEYRCDALTEAKDDLVTWADAHGHEITR